jgi:phosphohistidine phosphatase
MRLYIVRHGIAVDREDPKCPPDPERYLTEKGVAKTAEVAKGAARLGLEPAVLLTSPYLRAVQTGEIFCEALKIPASKLRRTDALLPMASPGQLFRELAKLKAETVICFGHAPNVDAVVAYALGSQKHLTEMKKSGVACLEMESVGAPPRGKLLWLGTPKLLR